MTSGRNIVLLSGGLDSSVNTVLAIHDGGVALAITCDYGQRPARQEIASARSICKYYGIKHRVVRIPWLGLISETPLTRASAAMPDPRKVGFNESDAQMWIPNRNGVFLNIAAAYAEALGVERVITGFNAEEAANFPDNTQEFVDATNAAFRYSCRRPVKALSYTVALNKRQILAIAREHDAPIERFWWCYDAKERLCGCCGSCVRVIAAAKEIGAKSWLNCRGVVFMEP
jgi:7-cyano-7-deazaguanine synthase